MRKVILSMMVTLDGFFEGPERNIDWHVVDDDFNQYAIDLMKTVDTMLFGRVTYQLFESYWPAAAKDPATSNDDLAIAKWIDKSPKVVFSKTLDNVQWQNSRLVREVNAEDIAKMKQQTGKDMVMYGGGSLAQSFMRLGLIDDYQIFVNPVILGRGSLLFTGLNGKLPLKLVETRVFKTGLVLLRYRPDRPDQKEAAKEGVL